MSTLSLKTVRHFVHEHDDLPAFHATYLVLTILAAALLNLGVFAVLIVLHMALDIVKYREVHRFSWADTAEGVIRESLLDITLLFLGLTFSVYLDESILLMAGAKGLMLAEFTILRAIGTVIPRISILYHFLDILSHLEHYLSRVHPRMNKPLSIVEYVCVVTLGITLSLLTFAAHILPIDSTQLLHILSREMVPWRL